MYVVQSDIFQTDCKMNLLLLAHISATQYSSLLSPYLLHVRL